jgi:hypothetical protein
MGTNGFSPMGANTSLGKRQPPTIRFLFLLVIDTAAPGAYHATQITPREEVYP